MRLRASARGEGRRDGRGARGAWALSLLFLAGLLAAACSCGEEPAPVAKADGPPAGAAQDDSRSWAQDDRLASLIQDCYGMGPYDRDTSDMLPVLVSKLESAQLDVLRNVREELARLGEPAIVELDRLVRRLYTDPHASPTILNALGVIQLSEAGGCAPAQELLRHCLGHPQETIRNAAVRALGVHAGAEAYDDLKAILRATHDTTKEIVVTALYTADRRRFEGEALAWLEEGTHSNVLRHAVKLIAQGADAETARACGELIARVEDPVLRGYLVATQAQADPRPAEPFAVLAEMLEGDDAHLRVEALGALEFTDATDLIASVLVSDSEPNLRLMACGLLGPRTDEKVARDALLQGVNDASDQIREACLAALLAVGDERAADTVLTLLGESQRGVGIAVRALRGRWEANPGLGERALALLRERFAARAGESLDQREFLVQALAQIPGPESTRTLLELAATSEEEIDRMDAGRWLLMQASNTGPAGIELLRERWRTETELGARFDLLWSASLGHDQGTREFLLEVLEAERSAPHERLYAAERLAREGPASVVAPRIKRANLRMRDPVFRPAMNCLLWRWYG